MYNCDSVWFFHCNMIQLLRIPGSRAKIYENSFTISAAKLWNEIPLYIRNIKDLETFKKNKWAAPSEFGTYRICEQRRFRRACASAQSRQNLRCSLIKAVSQEEPSDRKPDPWPLWMAGHAQLKFVMTECSKTQIRLARLKWNHSYIAANNDPKFNKRSFDQFHRCVCRKQKLPKEQLIQLPRLFTSSYFHHQYPQYQQASTRSGKCSRGCQNNVLGVCNKRFLW